MIDPDSVDPVSVDWPQVAQSEYLVHQHVIYEYPVPIEDLRHRLVVIPPRTHGDQRRLTYLLDVSNPEHQLSTHKDPFGNLVVDLSVPRVERSIEFQAWIVVERHADRRPHRVGGAWLQDRRLLEATALTRPDDALSAAAAELMAPGSDALELAGRISTWVHQNVAYERGVTDVRTTAAEALGLGRGVCQDYAHVMLALCRLCDIPARYVSGHLLGEGAMHAWVEVLLPSPEDEGDAVAWPFDPTHDRAPALSYVTVAVGRDYRDVSPTRGTFRAGSAGYLSSHKCVSVTALQLRLL